jgi:hypothetical protein
MEDIFKIDKDIGAKLMNKLSSKIGLKFSCYKSMNGKK